MRNARLLGIAGLAVIAAAAVAVAQTSVNPLPETAATETAPLTAEASTDAVTALAKTRWGDAQAGAAKAGACAACHGLDGNAMQQSAPRIAGMPERYLARQLALFKDNHRTTGLASLMKPYADVLSAQDMRDLGAHYATQRSGAGVASDAEITDEASPYKGMAFYKPGQDLYRTGDAGRGIPACLACHGPSGAGNPGPAYPSIGGQEAGYLVRRLQEYRAGNTADPDRQHFDQMAAIARQLTDEEILSLASYAQGLHDRADGANAEQVAAVRAAGTLPAAPGLPASLSAPATVAAPAPAEAAAPVTADAPADTATR